MTELALTEARRRGIAICVAVVDAAGHLLAFQRAEGAGLISIDVALGKARTAALFGAPASIFERMIDEGGKTSMLSVPGMVPLGGGKPVTVNDVVVGAIGISGATGDDDEEIATAVIAAFEKAL